MVKKRQLAGTSSEQEEEIATKTKAAKKNKPSYVVKDETHEEAGFYRGDLVRSFVPKNELGDTVDKFLFWVFSEEEEGNMVQYDSTKPDIDHAGNDDIASFFEPLDQSYMASLSFFQEARGTFAGCMANGLKNKEGSAIEQMKAFAKWYASEENYMYGPARVKKLDWLIKKLEAKGAKLGITGRS